MACPAASVSKSFWFQSLILETFHMHMLLHAAREPCCHWLPSHSQAWAMADHILSPRTSHWDEHQVWTEHSLSKVLSWCRDTLGQVMSQVLKCFSFAKASQQVRDALFKSNEHLGCGNVSTWVFLSLEPNDLLQRVTQWWVWSPDSWRLLCQIEQNSSWERKS